VCAATNAANSVRAAAADRGRGTAERYESTREHSRRAVIEKIPRRRRGRPDEVARVDDPWKSGVGEFIRAQRELANLSLRQLSEIAKVSNPYLSQIERGLHKPSADVLKNIASALKISAETMYAQAGLLDGTPPADVAGAGPGVEAAVRQDGQLSADQKETLIRIYRGFVERA
jgi:transcriptional regulator with XRE-family HTH domain